MGIAEPTAIGKLSIRKNPRPAGFFSSALYFSEIISDNMQAGSSIMQRETGGEIS
jgi:hypothetical protein